jgi:hypothetical protein
MVRNDTILCDRGSIMAYNGLGIAEGGDFSTKFN